MLEFEEEDDVFDVLNWGLCWQVNARHKRSVRTSERRKSHSSANCRVPRISPLKY